MADRRSTLERLTADALGMKKLLLRRLKTLEEDANSWINHFKEITDYIAPRRGRYLSDGRSKSTRGRKRNTKIIDSTGVQALRILVAGMTTGMTSPARPWFRFATPDPDMMDFVPIKVWVSKVEKVCYRILARSNFYNVIQTVYAELGGFGTGPLYRQADVESIVRFRPYTAGEYYIAEDDNGRVDTLYRRADMTISQIVGQFVAQDNGDMDWDVASTAVRNAWDRGNYDTAVEVVHVIEPRFERNRGRLDGKNKPIKSIYFELAGTGDKLLRESGFNRKPFYVPRWDTLGGDTYGRSPGMDALGDVKQLQQEQRRKAQGIDKMVNPPMTAPTSLRGKPSTVLPGGTTYLDTQQGQQGFAPAYQVTPRVAELTEDIRETQQRVMRAFYADLFAMMITSDRRQITATEVVERHEEKLMLLGPVLTNVTTELLDPLLDDIFLFALERGMLPPPPPDLADVDLGVEYISILAQAQQAVSATALERVFGFAGNLSGVRPDVLDRLDFDMGIEEYAEILGATPKIIIPQNVVNGIREQRAQQAAQAAALEQAKQGAEAAKLLSEADTQQPNALGELLRARGG